MLPAVPPSSASRSSAHHMSFEASRFSCFENVEPSAEDKVGFWARSATASSSTKETVFFEARLHIAGRTASAPAIRGGGDLQRICGERVQFCPFRSAISSDRVHAGGHGVEIMGRPRAWSLACLGDRAAATVNASSTRRALPPINCRPSEWRPALNSTKAAADFWRRATCANNPGSSASIATSAVRPHLG